MADPVTVAAAASAAASSVAASSAAASVGFWAGLFGFIGGVMLTWWALIALLVFGILLEHNGARGWALFIALVTAVTAYFFFNVSLMTILIGAGAYLVIGLLWSFWRYKRQVDKMIELHKGSDQSTRERVLRNLQPKEMLGTITAWILIWPFSMVENILGDILTFIQSLVTRFFRGVYNRIYDSAVAALK